jgi:hypothetical protein
VTDDYGLDRVWFEYHTEGGVDGERSLTRAADGVLAIDDLGRFDLRGSDEPGGGRSLVLAPGSKLSLVVKAIDRYDLIDESRAGSSQQFSLEVVTVAQLLALLDNREVALRERYEAIYEKVTDTRNLLARVEFAASSEVGSEAASQTLGGKTDDGEEDGNVESPPQTPAAAAERELARRRLRVAGALQNIVQSGEEIVGVAEAFDDLHDQLTNNRIDNPDLKSRLREQIAQPLHRIGTEQMPQLRAQVQLIEQHITDDDTARADRDKSLALIDNILVSMQQVLNRMRELETYNEVVALLRGIISDQEEVNRRTKELQRERLQSLLED